MRVAVLADVHGNLPALEAVLQDISRHSPDYVVAAGDLALRGAHPAEVVDLLKDRCHALLMGNTDCYLAGNYLGGAYRERDHWKTELLHWTRDRLGEERVRLLGSLPFSTRYSPRRGQDLFICHANPRNLEDSIEPTLDDNTLRRFLSHVEASAVAFGHLHFPYRRRLGRVMVADVASAGIPRDGDLRPAWGLFTFNNRGWRVQIRRVRYAVRHATQSLQQLKVPGASLLIHKMLEARYRHHALLSEAARKHSGLPPHQPYLKPPPWAKGLRPAGHANPLGAPALPSPLGLQPAPPPGQSTQEDEASDELIVPNPLLSPPSEHDLPETDGEQEAGDDSGDTPNPDEAPAPDRAASGD